MIGYDKFALNHQLVLDLTMDEATGATGDYIFGRERAHHPVLLHGATIAWTQLASGLYVIDLTSATPDWLDCSGADTADLDFTTEAFSMVFWLYMGAPMATSMILCRGLANTDGWMVLVTDTGRIQVATCQAAATQTTSSTAVIDAATWYFIGITRDEANVLTYINGLDVTDAPDTHIDITTSARELHIGIRDDETSDPLDGYLWRPRIWDTRVLAQWEFKELFEIERHWFD